VTRIIENCEERGSIVEVIAPFREGADAANPVVFEL
jgi:hypothetical protein